MGVSHQVIGNTVAEWDGIVPLKWTMSETIGPNNDQRKVTKSFDLSELSEGYEEGFLLTLKNLLISRRKRVALITIHCDYSNILSVLRKVQKQQKGNPKFAQFNHAFLNTLQAMRKDFSAGALARFKRLFNSNRESPLYAHDIVPADFPLKLSTKGQIGQNIDIVLAKALSRAACVEVLRRGEDAYESGVIDIGCFAFLNLAFHIYCRLSSYRHLTLADLQVDIDPETQIKTYFLWVIPKKTRVSTKSLKKISYRLDSTVGELLEAQRIHVIKTWGHHFGEKDIGKIALFPSRGVGEDGRWSSIHSQMNYGETYSQDFYRCYLMPILKLQDSITFNLTALRHTVGTQLAVAGCSATTIASVLKHATPDACQKYVDIAFNGLINALSDAMTPAFDAHFPAFNLFRSKNDPVTTEKAINSIDLATGRRELIGECGKTHACQYAPIACYPCPRFTPCFDADHIINLRLVESEISKYEQGGLPFRELTSQYKDARRYIQLVVAAANQYQDALAQGGVRR